MPLGVFLHLPDGSSGYIPEECESLRQSLFPASRIPRVGGNVQVIPLLVATVHVRDRLSVLCVQRCALRPTWYLLLFPVLIMLLQGIALGLGLIVSSLTTKYRDLTNFFGVFVSLWMYATPIVYPLSYVTNPTLHKIMLLNPMTAIIETFKYGAYGAGQFSWTALAYSFGCMIVLLIIGIAMFNRKQKSFIDTKIGRAHV